MYNVEIGPFFGRGAFPKGSHVSGVLRALGGLGLARPRLGVEDEERPPRSGKSWHPLHGDILVFIPSGGCHSRRIGSLSRTAAAWVAVCGSACRKQVLAASGSNSGDVGEAGIRAGRAVMLGAASGVASGNACRD
jgi:hypothetical protein